MWQRSNHVDAERLGPVLLVAVAEREGPRAPATAVVAAAQGANCMNELMMGIRCPVRGLASTRDDDARPVARSARLGFDGRRQVHQQADRGDGALSVMDEPNELAKAGRPRSGEP